MDAAFFDAVSSIENCIIANTLNVVCWSFASLHRFYSRQSRSQDLHRFCNRKNKWSFVHRFYNRQNTISHYYQMHRFCRSTCKQQGLHRFYRRQHRLLLVHHFYNRRHIQPGQWKKRQKPLSKWRMRKF